VYAVWCPSCRGVRHWLLSRLWGWRV